MREQLIERFMNFAVNVYKLDSKLCKTYSGKHVYGQLFRAATSAGSNYNESTAAESKKDFIHKMQLSLKELREARYWIAFIEKSELVSNENQELQNLLKESTELLNIIGKAVSTAKKNIKN